MITIAIVEDIKDIREGLRLLIGSSDGFSCTEMYESAEEAINNIPRTQPDVVLMDINLPGKNGIEAVRILKEKCPATQFIMSTIYEDSSSIFDSLKAGANGYLLKKTAPVKILEAIIEVYNGGSPMSAQIARKVITSFQDINQHHTTEILTPKEKEILKGLSEGLRFKEIAPECI